MKTTEDHNQWMDFLSLIVLSIHASIHSDVSHAAFTLSPQLPGQTFEASSTDFDARNDATLYNMYEYF